MSRRWLSILGVLLLTGCGSSLAERQAELARWIGRPETELVQAMGAPNRSYETENIKVLTYEDSQVFIWPGTPYWQTLGPYPWGTGGSLPPQAINSVCDTTFTVSGGVVKAFSLRGNGC